MALSEEDGRKSYTAIGRILVMCTLYGIQLDEKGSVLYLWLNKIKDRWDADNDEDMAFKDFEEELLKKYEGDREELIALREFAYKSTTEEDMAASNSLDEMKAAIADLRLVIIGGHINFFMFTLWIEEGGY